MSKLLALLIISVALSACGTAPTPRKEIDLSRCVMVKDTHNQMDHSRKGMSLYRCGDGKSLLLKYKA